MIRRRGSRGFLKGVSKLLAAESTDEAFRKKSAKSPQGSWGQMRGQFASEDRLG